MSKSDVPVLSWWQKIAGQFYPQLLREASSEHNEYLQLCWYRGSWQLNTYDAQYTDSQKYRPLTRSFNYLKHELADFKTVLMLGGGLGAGVHLLHHRGLSPQITVVEQDAVIVEWCQQLLPEKSKKTAKVINANAASFLAKSETTYDLLILDVFDSRWVPEDIAAPSFLKKLPQHLNSRGFLIFNYIVHSPVDAQRILTLLKSMFDSVKVLSFDTNRVYVCRKTA